MTSHQDTDQTATIIEAYQFDDTELLLAHPAVTIAYGDNPCHATTPGNGPQWTPCTDAGIWQLSMYPRWAYCTRHAAVRVRFSDRLRARQHRHGASRGHSTAYSRLTRAVGLFARGRISADELDAAKRVNDCAVAPEAGAQ
jgi:hypothetical protein